MNPVDILKQFKNIEPEPAYKEHAKRLVLATAPKERWSITDFVVRAFETGVAVALTVFFILIVTGQLAEPYGSANQFSVINPTTLNAEAQAVDIQIQLAQVAYQETAASATVATTTSESTLPAAPGSGGVRAGFATAALHASGAAATSTPDTQATTTTVSVDDALQVLSQ